MKVYRLLFLSLFFGTQITLAQTGLNIPQLTNFDTAMNGLLKRYNVPGGQLAITRYGRLIYNRGFGYADTLTHSLVEPNSIFRLASVSKPITSITLMHLFQEGKFHLDDTVFGPRGILNDTNYSHIKDPRVYNITLRNLLTHSGGWNRDISGDPMFESWTISTAMGVTPPAGPVTIIDYVLRNQMLDFTPGTQYQYSNFGFCILGRVIEKITGEAYENYVRDTILIPIGITDMKTGFNLLKNQLPMEVSYYDYPGEPYTPSVYDNVTMVPFPYAGFNIEAMDSHGAWVASAADLCKILVSVDGYYTAPDILSPSTIDTMTHPSATNANYALGWQVNQYHNWWHTGSLPGTSTEIVRASNQMNWAILLNYRPENDSAITAAVDQLVWNVIPTIKSWDTLNLFTAVNTIPVPNLPTVTIYPVPSNGTVNILLAGSGYSSVRVIDLLGKEVYSTSVDSQKRDQHLFISIPHVTNGLYIIQVTSEKGVVNKRLVIEK